MNDELKSKHELILEIQHLRKHLKHAHDFDNLTLLPNRRHFFECLERLLKDMNPRETSLALFLIDIDRFQAINDYWGYAIGDNVIQEVSRRLQQLIPDLDHLARFSGDQFLVMLPNFEHEDDIEQLAQQLLSEMSQVMTVLSGQEIHITTSIGVSVYPTHARDSYALLHQANLALHQAKEEGRNQLQYYDPRMYEAHHNKLAIESELKKALDRNQFYLHYQPQMNMKNGQIDAMEALLRWDHPRMGMVHPADFIPIAEETGLIVPIGRWVLQEACRQTKLIQEKGFPHLKVAVNMSFVQLKQHDIVEDIQHALCETGLDPRSLELELTETVFIQDFGEVREKLTLIKALGIQIVIDDFGTGYSGLQYLQDLIVDKLKIDQAFIHEINEATHDKPKSLISTSIIHLAKSMDIDIIAEGVETQEQLTFLTENDCHMMQGFLFSRPVSAEKFETLLHIG